MKTIGQRIKAARKRLGLTQNALAVRMGVTSETIHRLEKSANAPNSDTLIALSDALGVSVDWLLKGTDPEPMHPPVTYPAVTKYLQIFGQGLDPRIVSRLQRYHAEGEPTLETIQLLVQAYKSEERTDDEATRIAETTLRYQRSGRDQGGTPVPPKKTPKKTRRKS